MQSAAAEADMQSEREKEKVRWKSVEVSGSQRGVQRNPKESQGIRRNTPIENYNCNFEEKLLGRSSHRPSASPAYRPFELFKQPRFLSSVCFDFLWLACERDRERTRRSISESESKRELPGNAREQCLRVVRTRSPYEQSVRTVRTATLQQLISQSERALCQWKVTKNFPTSRWQLAICLFVRLIV